MDFKDRKIIQKIYRLIKNDEILVLHGSRQVGKTTILKILIEKLQKDNISPGNIIYFDLEDFVLLDLCNKGVKDVINYIESRNVIKDHKIYLLIDEIQYLENPSSFLKLFYDHYKNKYKLIVSGSSSFNIRSKFKDSLVGRIIDFEIFSLDFEEFLNFKGASINLFNIKNESIHDELRDYYKEWVIYGGYPKVVLENNIENKQIYLKQVINTYIKKDIGDYASIRNIQKFNNLLRILADQSGSLLNVYELSNTLGLARQTIEDYLFILENTYIIRRIPPYFFNVRSELTKTPKIFFEDMGIHNLLRYGMFIEKIDGSTLENSVYSLLRKNMDIDTIKFWRTTDKKEIDFLIDQIQSLFAIEVKLTFTGKTSNIKQLLSFYSNGTGYILTLHKIKESNHDVKILYPWELYATELFF